MAMGLLRTWLLLFFVTSCSCVDFFSPLVAVGASAASKLESLVCLTGMTECCDEKWVKRDMEGLERDLKKKLHGQHLVIPIILSAIRGHVTDQNPKKPLVLSFHGWTGGGKSFVTQMIIDNLFKKGEESKFVHIFHSGFHFKHQDKVGEYKDQLHSWIFQSVSKCGHSLFIFDEMDHMPEGMIDVLIPILGHNTQVDKVDFRKTIFIFMSNIGGDLITQTAFKHWESKKSREELSLQDMQKPLEISAFKLLNGLKGSDLIRKQLIDYFVPFLPLERKHVRECVVDEFERRNVTAYKNKIEKVLDELDWWPDESKLYSKCGCTKVTHKTMIANV